MLGIETRRQPRSALLVRRHQIHSSSPPHGGREATEPDEYMNTRTHMGAGVRGPAERACPARVVFIVFNIIEKNKLKSGFFLDSEHRDCFRHCARANKSNNGNGEHK